MSERIRVVVKPTAGGDKLEKLVELASTIEELKQALAADCGIPADAQRLIYRGQILRDERTVSSYGIEADHVLHLVRGKPAGATQGSDGSGSSPATGAAAAGIGGASAGSGGGSAGGAAAAGGLPHPLAGMMDPGMQQMLQSPLMQQLLSNPELVRRMLQMNPAVRELMDRDPQMAQLLNNPELLRESMSIVSNPSLMREYMRNNDRALSNLEALPGGFNALRQLYENVQEPLMSAAAGADANPFAGLMQGAAAAGSGSAAAAGGATTTSTSGGGGDQPSTQPLPNPWAPQGGDAAGAAAGVGSPSGLPNLAALLGQAGGGDGMGGAPPGMAELTNRMMQDPAMRESMVAMMSQPGMVDMLTAANPQLRGLLDAVPGVRAMLQSPEMLRTMLSPDMMRAMTGMQQRMAGGEGGGAAGGPPLLDPAALASMLSGAVGGGGAPGSAGGAPAGMEGLMGLLGAMQMGMGGGLGGLGAGLGMPTPVADPESTYATQIQQLTDMGFFDREANIRALQATGGNVNAAVERLLQGP